MNRYVFRISSETVVVNAANFVSAFQELNGKYPNRAKSEMPCKVIRFGTEEYC